MAVIDNYNRIISVYFYPRVTDAHGNVGKGQVNLSSSIVCPENGRKPNITINGLFTTDECVPMFNLTIKNLYLDNIAARYPFIRVEAGYKGNIQPFEATILYSFTESPGPEGETVIHCIQANAPAWLSTTLKIDLKEGFAFSDALDAIAGALGAKTSPSEGVKSLVSKDKFVFEGMAKDAIQELKKHFIPEINIKLMEDTLYASIDAEDIGGSPIDLPFLTTPPQLVGGKNNSVLATIQTLWNPKIKPGSKVSFYASYYSTQSVMANVKEKLTMNVNTVQFQFSTTKGGNQMTLTGQII